MHKAHTNTVCLTRICIRKLKRLNPTHINWCLLCANIPFVCHHSFVSPNFDHFHFVYLSIGSNTLLTHQFLCIRFQYLVCIEKKSRSFFFLLGFMQTFIKRYPYTKPLVNFSLVYPLVVLCLV